MATELSTTQKPADAGAATDKGTQAGALSSSVFQNPQDFFQTLKDNWSKIDASGNEQVGKADLVLFATESTDPKAKAAATIAYEHFDQLEALPDLTISNGANPNDSDKKGISADDINFDMVLASGNIDATIQQQENLYRDMALVESGLAVGAIAGGVIGTFTLDPLLAIGSSSAVVPLAIFAASDYVGWEEVGSDIRNASARSQATLSSWSEINGAKST